MPASSLTLLVGVWIGFTLAEKEAQRLEFAKDKISNLIFLGLWQVLWAVGWFMQLNS
jgi:hypothetical protein